MNQHQLLAALFQRGVQVWADGDQLRVRAPKGALTPELRDSLAMHKQEILVLVGSSTSATRAAHVPLVSVARHGNVPLSLSQQRLWYLAQLHPDSPVYNLPKALRLTGRLNVTALGQSIREIVQRHEIFRTTFPAVEGRPVQRISSDMPVPLRVADLRALHGTEQQAEAQRLAAEESRQPFNLAQGPLLRVRLLQLGEEAHLFLLTVHHLVFDGWSFNVFCRELAALYDAFSTGTSSPLPALPMQYADFAHWEQQWLQPEVLESQLAYWEQQLGGSVAALALPIDRPRPPGNTSQGAQQSLVLPQHLTASLKALSQREESTLFMTLLAAFQTLLYHYTGQEDILVCSPVAGRHRSETRELIGYFTRLLPMRTDLSGNPSFRDVLGRVRRVVSEAYAHQDVPLQRLAEFPNLVRTPLSRGMFLLQTPSQLPEPLGLTASRVDVHNGTADFDLSLSMEEIAATLTGVLEYKTALFEATTISQMTQHLQTLLEEIVAHPEQRIAALSLQNEAGCHQLLAVQNDIQTDSALSDVLPLTPNGKVGCPALPAPGRTRAELGSTFVAPRDALELQLTNIWEKVLDKKPLGVRDNFFALGGHSLLAVRLFAAIQKSFGKNLPLATLFQAPTVEHLGGILRDARWSPHWSSLVAIQPGGSKPPFFCVAPLGSTVLALANVARHLGTEQPFYGFEPLGLNGEQAPHTRIEDMAAHYIQEMQTLQPEGPYFLGGICFGSLVAFEMAQQLLVQGEKTTLICLDPIRPLASPPLGSHASRSSLGYYVYGMHRLMHYVRHGQLTGELKSRMAKMFQPRHLRRLWAAHIRARLSYSIQAFPGRFVLIQSIQSLQQIRHNNFEWSELAAGRFDHHILSISHAGMFREPSVQVVAAQLMACLEEAQADDCSVHPR